MVHILQIQNALVQSAFDAAESRASLPWTFPKKAKPGHDALIFSRSRGFLGRAKILSPPKPADSMGWPGQYGGEVGEIRLFDMSVPLDYVRTEMPGFAWARYPRSYTTLDPGTAAQLETVIDDFQEDNLDFVHNSLSMATEGARRLVYVNSYERSRKAREDCKRIHGATCVACGFESGVAQGQSRNPEFLSTFAGAFRGTPCGRRSFCGQDFLLQRPGPNSEMWVAVLDSSLSL